jgi:hypothetical protein
MIWAIGRSMNHSMTIVGDETLDIDVLNTDPLKGKRPLPPTIISQIEISITSILMPLRPEVMQLLSELIKTQDYKYWLPVYLSIFVLLHNCAMGIQHNNARQERYGHSGVYSMQKTSLNLSLIRFTGRPRASQAIMCWRP